MGIRILIIAAIYIASVLIVRWLERLDFKKDTSAQHIYFLWFCPLINTIAAIAFSLYMLLYLIYENTIEKMLPSPKLIKFWKWFLNKDIK